MSKKKGIITIPGHGIEPGHRIKLASPGGALTDTPMVVVSTTKNTVIYRPLYWHERLRDWLKFEVKHNYQHPKGTVDICQAFERNMYCDEIVVMPNTRLGRLVQRFYNFQHRHEMWICEYDARTLGLDNSEQFPWWSLSWWWYRPIQFANRFFPRISGYERREWPEVL